ncbi:hypothetical protein ACFVHB_13215 [Kitasatospora sp. NPDC127111]|uniref:hypothetical protein n=1 Tax=Kitasatospora sp. NPDC127111 TaxID=3345363 RepID=UPI003629EECE
MESHSATALTGGSPARPRPFAAVLRDLLAGAACRLAAAPHLPGQPHRPPRARHRSLP